MRSLVPLFAVGALCAVGAASPCLAQAAGSLRFSGSAAVGESVDIVVTGGPAHATLALVLSPEVGQTLAGSFETDCFALSAAGFAMLDLPLNGQGSLRATLPIPAAPSLTGVYLAGLALAPTAGLPRTNCASFLVVAAEPSRPSILETFDTSARADPALAAADWARSVRGIVRPGRIGGDGELGSFDPTLGTLENGVYVFRTDDQTFPGSVTLSGAPRRVTDGVFEFLDFVVPVGVTVRFEGARAARILVAGAARIDGTLDVSAPAVEVGDGSPGLEAGQLGGAGGAGAGAGGAGGDLPSLIGGAVDGSAGEDLRSSPFGAYAGSVTGTGGRGSPATPPMADPLAVTYAFFGLFSNQIAAGGGGGGHVASGAPGRVDFERPPSGSAGTPGAGGAAIGTPGTPTTSRGDLLIGGSGGGGGGVHPYDSVRPTVVWTRGGGGAGGGGAIVLAVGGDLTIGAQGAIRADGGAAARRDESDGAFLAPGGGGSGGSVLLQVGGAFTHDGEVSARGGAGGVTEDLRVTQGSAVAGGDGGPGRVRVEGPVPVGLGTFDPPPELGTLGDRDAWTAAASRWIPLPVGADPAALDYELYTVQDALTVLYSDRPGTGVGPAVRSAAPTVLLTRLGQIDAQRQPVPGTAGPWTEGSAVEVPGANAVQFLLLFDRTSAGIDLRVEALRLSF